MSPGRGSGAGSLVCYLTKITEVDPLKPGYELIFERFINPERDSFPDIDQDFQHDRRGEVIEYCVDKYGEDKVAYIMTIGTMGAKNALRDVGRRFGLTPFEVNELSKAVPPAVRGRSPSLADALKDDKFLDKLNSDSRYQQVYDVATIIEGMAKSTGVHAAGVLIGDERPIVEQLPCMTDKEDKIVAAVEGPIAEGLGYIKFDFLGLKTQTTLHKTVDWIHLNHGVKIDLDLLEDGDEKVYDMMCAGKLAGLFQLSGSSGFREVTMKMKPRDIPGIADITSIYRPGPLDNGFVPKYTNNVNRVARGLDIIYEMKVDNPKVQKEVEKILQPTYGVCLYQEQIQFIAQVVAGYSLGGADLLRRAIGKKKMSEMEAQKKMFINGAKKNGVSETSARGLFTQIEKFADYCFNKSHAIAYSIITYQTAWLKYYYPTEFFAACLTEVQDNQDKTVGFITACKREGITILPPDINKSDIEYTPTEDGIIFGLGAIKGVGEAAIRPILEARKDGKFKSFFDFMSRVNLTKVKKSDIKVLVEAGCFNSLL